MEFNRLVSLVLGFIVLILLFVWIASRFRASSRNTASNVTPTVTVTFTPSPTPTQGEGGRSWNPFGFLSRGKSPTPTPTVPGQTVVSQISITPTPTQGGRSWNPFGFLFRGKSPTPTPTVPGKTVVRQITITPSPTKGQITGTNVAQVETTGMVYKNNRNGQTTTYTIDGVQQIPQTGAPTMVIPLALSALSFGAYLRKRS